MEKVDILAIGAHPDDVELAYSGTILKQVQSGSQVAIVDLTRGELGTRGSAEIREKEARLGADVMGVKHRTNLGLADGFFEINEVSLLKVVEQIRRHQPQIVITNAEWDRHPDHARGGDLVSRACFLSGLRKVVTSWEGIGQEAWRPKVVYRSVQDRYIEPDFVVDVTSFWEKRMESVKAYATQFYDPNSEEPESPISSKSFLENIDARALHYGRLINVRYAEGFTCERPIGVENLLDLT